MNESSIVGILNWTEKARQLIGELAEPFDLLADDAAVRRRAGRADEAARRDLQRRFAGFQQPSDEVRSMIARYNAMIRAQRGRGDDGESVSGEMPWKHGMTHTQVA